MAQSGGEQAVAAPPALWIPAAPSSRRGQAGKPFGSAARRAAASASLAGDPFGSHKAGKAAGGRAAGGSDPFGGHRSAATGPEGRGREGNHPFGIHGAGGPGDDPFSTHADARPGTRDSDLPSEADAEGEPLLAGKRSRSGFVFQSVPVLVLIQFGIFLAVSAAYALPPPSPMSRLLFGLVACVGAAFGTLLLCVYFFVQPFQRRRSVYLYLGLMCCIAVVAGWVAGRLVYEQDTARFWLESARPTYDGVVPSAASAAGLSDAAFVRFAEGVKVQLARVLDYRPHGSSTTYCVAPILDDGDLAEAGFWATGTDCCGRLRDFRCGDALDPDARAGAVISADSGERASETYDSFRHAVRQAAALYHMRAPEAPILVRWLKDPEAENGGSMVRGMMSFLFVCLLYLMVSVASALWFHWSVNKRLAV